MRTVRTLSRISSLVLLAAIGALVASLVVLFIADSSHPIVGAAMPPGKRTGVAIPVSSRHRVSTVADEPSSPDLEGDLSDRAGANEGIPAISSVSASPPVVPVDTDHDGSEASRVLANRQSTAAGFGGSADAAAPLGWCFRAQSGFTWQETGAGPGPQHELASDTSVVWQGSASARIGAANDSLPSAVVGVMWQAVVATPLRGKRVEVSAYVRSRITQIGHLFVRTQAKVPLELLLSDQNAPGARGLNRYVPRNAEWDRYSVVFDVPSDAEVLYYGFELYGGGYVWIDDVGISIADTGSALTHYGSVGGNHNIAIDPSWILPAPLNLGFELTSDGPTGGAEASHPACASESANG
jgi:hypothetical protein